MVYRRRKGNAMKWLLFGVFLLIGAKFSAQVKNATKKIPVVGGLVNDSTSTTTESTKTR